MDRRFDIVVIGAGHAGIEAAWMASEFGFSVAIVTMPDVPIASAPCNPSVGGVGKGQVVREVDALGGLMGRLADLSAIQCRTLNESKGYAVQSTRVQIDKENYPLEAQRLLCSRPGIAIVQEKVEAVEKRVLFEVSTSRTKLCAPRLVVTTGTFLGGRLHVGEGKTPGGRPGCGPSKGLGSLFEGIKTLGVQFKTGTPPRLDSRTIDFSKMQKQHTNERSRTFHFAHGLNERFLEQVPCYLTRTNADTLGIIRNNLGRSPLYNGRIKAIGARYCPSIEDKAHRYPDRSSHHVFIEPESLEGHSFYPSGLSSSLPEDIQLAFIRTIPGLEQADILLYGHAVEYDVVDTSLLDETLHYRDVEGLYFAGQVNGTSGYEEAAGQGLIAGANAALSLKGCRRLVLSREDSYIGVMIEDLVSNRRDEPYRLFTARNENRLFVREDNTHIRMAPYRASMGLDGKLDGYQKGFLTAYEELWELMSSVRLRGMLLKDLLKRPYEDATEFLIGKLAALGSGFDPRVVHTAAVAAHYEGHIKKAAEQRGKYTKLSGKKINWESISASDHISNECKERIRRIRPSTFSALQRIDGIRPATLAYVAGAIVS